jgi:serine/threonine protein kinase
LLSPDWKPSRSHAIDTYILFSPLSTSTLHAAIHDLKLSSEIYIPLFAQVLEGVAHLHQNGVTHRDIKPQNIVITSYDPPDAKIIDFGCATSKSSTIYDKPGTLIYLAPEQVQGRCHGREVDYWACGLVGAQILGFQLRERILSEPSLERIITWLSNKNDDPIARCCVDMLKYEPSQRTTAKDAFIILSQFLLKNADTAKKRKSMTRQL